MAIHDIIMAAAGASPKVTSSSFIASATSSTGTITIPASAQTGDLAIFVDRDGNTTTTPPSIVTPSGWTLINSVSGITITTSSGRASIFYRVLQSGDPGSSVTGMNNGYTRKLVLVFRPNATISTVTVSTANSYFGDSVTGTQTVSAASGSPPLIVFAHMAVNVNTSLSTRSFSPAQDATITNGVTQEMRYKIYNSSPSDTTMAISTARNGNTLQTFYISLI